jgi:hypothetical protein
VNLRLGGQVKGEMPNLYLISAQGNPLRGPRIGLAGGGEGCGVFV